MAIFPIDPTLAAKARKLQKKGLKGEAISEQFGKGVTTDEANLLAAIGAGFEDEANAKLSQREIDILLGLAALHREDRLRGVLSSPKTKHLAWRLRLSVGQVRRAAARLSEPDYREAPGIARYAYLHHSTNGHIWLNASGWAFVQAVEAMLATRQGSSQ